MEYSGRRRGRGRRPAERAVEIKPETAQWHSLAWDSAQWDDTVDVICIGPRTVGLAAAMVAQTLDLSAELVITASRDAPRSAGVAERLGISDPETVKYLASVTDDIPAPPGGPGTAELPIRLIDAPVPVADVHGAALPTFNGAALQTWAGTCLASPAGVLSTKVADPNRTLTYHAAGRAIETLAVGSVDFDARQGIDFDDWMVAWADDHDVVTGEANELLRLVFDGGDVVGAVLSGPAGVQTVGARHAVVLAIGTDDQRCVWPTDGADGVGTAQVVFVTRAASRFGRLELLIPMDGPGET